jgi:nicotinamidase-related amidase
MATDTNPYPWPYDGPLDPRRLALVVCGAQRGLVAATPCGAQVLEQVVAAARRLRALGAVIVWLRHGGIAGRRPTWLPVPGSRGWTLAVEPAATDLVADAAGWDGCFGSPLDRDLRALGRDHVGLAGIASEITVDSTVRTLNDRGYECLVLTDCCAPLDARTGRHAFHSLTMSGGIFGALGTTDALVDALTRTETTP